MTASLRKLSSKADSNTWESFTRSGSWSECIKSHHAQMPSGKGLPSRFWDRNNVRSILPGLKRKRTGLLLSGPKSSFQMKVNYGPRVWRKSGEAQNPCCLKSSVKFPQSVMIWAAMSSAGVGPLCFVKSTVNAAIYQEIVEHFILEVFTEDPRPDPGPVRVRVYILNGQPGPGRVPIYYFGSRVCLTLCVIPESIGEHRTCQWSVSVGTLCVFCNLQLVKLEWEKYERE